jgi:hypothetical protein
VREIRSTNRILAGKAEGKISIRRPELRWEKNIGKK